MSIKRWSRIGLFVAAFAGAALASPVPEQVVGGSTPLAAPIGAEFPVYRPSYEVPAVPDARLAGTLSGVQHRKHSFTKSTVFGTTDFVNDANQDVESSVEVAPVV